MTKREFRSYSEQTYGHSLTTFKKIDIGTVPIFWETHCIHCNKTGILKSGGIPDAPDLFKLCLKSIYELS